MSKADNMLSILWMLRSGKKMTARKSPMSWKSMSERCTAHRFVMRQRRAIMPIPGRTAAFGSSGSLRNPR